MGFKRFVEIGRVVIINYGPYLGKLAVIIDLITTNKVVVQGLKGGIRRMELSLNRCTLTDHVIKIKRGEKREAVFKAIEDYKLEDKFKESSLAKKTALRQRRANLTDFDRFKVMRLRQKRSALRHKLAKSVKVPAKKGEAKKGEKKEKGDHKKEKAHEKGKKENK